MFRTKKILSALLALALVFNVAAIGSSAALGDGSELSANVELVAGRLSAGVFTPLALGETIAKDEIIAVRIIPQTDFLCGSVCFVAMFDKTLFTLMGTTAANTFTVNTDKGNLELDYDTYEYIPNASYKGNLYYDLACSGYAGSINMPDSSWPASFGPTENYNVYKAIKVNTQADATSYSAGYPEVIPGTWLFQFRLRAAANIVVGTDARIWSDSRWYRTPANTSIDGYFNKCTAGQLSSAGSSTTYNFLYDFDKADITLPLKLPTQKSSIIFNTDGGSAVSNLRGDVGSSVIPPATPTKTGYNFAGWIPELPSVFPENDLNVTAQWTIKRSTVTFNSNGGSAVTAVTGDYGTAVPVPASPSREGYNFNGWQPTIPATFPESDITITAQWTIKQITVTFDSAGGSAVSPRIGNYGTVLQAPASPVRSGYEFVGWNPILPATFPAENFTTTAVWVKRITITFNSDGGSPVSPRIGNEGAPVVPPAAPSRTGYDFAGWNPALPANYPSQDITVTALWTPKQITISFNSNGGTEVQPITGNFGTPVAPPADPTKPGFIFMGWGPEVPPAFPAADITLEAQWLAIDYYVDITYNDEPIDGSLKIVVPWTTMYSSVKIQLGYVTNIENAARVEYISATPNMIIDQEGNITNKGFLVRSSNITVNVYDADENIVATKTVNVMFYKTILEVLMVRLQDIIQKIMSLFGN